MYLFIVNPIAGNGRGIKIFLELKKLALFSELKTRVFVTEYKGHAKEIAQEISQSAITNTLEAVTVIGGDGTLHEVVNGLSKDIPIAFIPAGSGNDFYRGAQLPAAHNDPDYFSIIIVNGISKWKVLFLFMTVFFGKHTAL